MDKPPSLRQQIEALPTVLTVLNIRGEKETTEVVRLADVLTLLNAHREQDARRAGIIRSACIIYDMYRVGQPISSHSVTWNTVTAKGRLHEFTYYFDPFRNALMNIQDELDEGIASLKLEDVLTEAEALRLQKALGGMKPPG